MAFGPHVIFRSTPFLPFYRHENFFHRERLMKKIILTGDRPTGQLHLGHYVGSLVNRVALQDHHTQFVMIADIQALTDHFERPEIITHNTYEVLRDYLAVGIDPLKTTIFIQSQIQELSELMIYFLNLVSVHRLERNPTIKAEIQQKGYEHELPAGFLCYPISQAADIAAFQAEVIPVGEDQVPLIEQTNEVVRRFNRIYNTNCLKEAKAHLSSTPRLIGINGKAKASKSLGNCIFLADTQEVVKEKVFSMYTDPNHIRINDPGQVEENVVFMYLDAFHQNKEEVEELKMRYRKGGLGDTTLKALLNDTLQQILLPIREKRNALQTKDLKEILYEGTKRARKCAQQTLEKVREAIGIAYFPS